MKIHILKNYCIIQVGKSVHYLHCDQVAAAYLPKYFSNQPN